MIMFNICSFVLIHLANMSGFIHDLEKLSRKLQKRLIPLLNQVIGNQENYDMIKEWNLEIHNFINY